MTSPETRQIEFGSSRVDVLDFALDDGPLSDAYWKVLHAFLMDSYETCSTHRARIDRAGVKVDQLRSYDDFRRLPLLGPEEVRAIPPFQLLPDRYQAAAASPRGFDGFPARDRIAKIFQTSSSTGFPKTSVYTLDDWEAQQSIIPRQHRHIPREKCSRIFNCFNPGHFGGKYIEDAFNRYGSVVVPRHFTHTSPAEIVAQLARGIPGVGSFNALAGPPWTPGPSKGASVDDLLNADLDNVIGREIRLIRTSGAPTDLPELRLRERVWEANDLAGAPRTEFMELYGCQEVGLPISECEKGELHIHQGLVYVEIVDEKTGRHVGPEERGLVAFTGIRHGSRFIRYLIGDEATYLTAPCTCVRTSPRIRKIRRVTELERLRGGCAAGGF